MRVAVCVQVTSRECFEITSTRRRSCSQPEEKQDISIGILEFDSAEKLKVVFAEQSSRTMNLPSVLDGVINTPEMRTKCASVRQSIFFWCWLGDIFGEAEPRVKEPNQLSAAQKGYTLLGKPFQFP